jgi:streptogramin lyase
MMFRKPKPVSQRDAMAALFACYARYGTARFPVPEGSTGAALRACRDRGWVWFPDPDHAVIVPAGVQALEPYGVRAEPKGYVE